MGENYCLALRAVQWVVYQKSRKFFSSVRKEFREYISIASASKTTLLRRGTQIVAFRLLEKA